MKKLITVLSIAALALTASVAFADVGHLNSLAKIELGQNKFVAVGTVAAEGSNSLTLNVQAGAHLNNVSNGQITVAFTEASDSVEVGNKVIVRGEIGANGSLEADSVRVIGEANGKAEVRARNQVAFGEITAVTGNSVTIKNNVTGETKTVMTGDDTKVLINGQAETAADIQVGDKGMVKFKAMLNTFIATMIRLFR